ncbi:MAG TPA: hypothetical protein DEP19_06335 [Anaerolineae bacterium]|nr:hypothetical protein [Anaerolineae bacterium]
MEDNENRENENREDEELDIELTLQHLLAYSSDPDLKKRVVEKISKNTNLPPEKIEESLQVLLKILMNMSRSN